MKSGKINWAAVIFVVFLFQAVGFIWYLPMVFGNAWLALIGKSIEELKASGGTPYLVAIIGAFLFAIIMSKIIHATDTHGGWAGVRLGFLIWLGFILPAVATHHYFQGHGWELVLIDSGHDLLRALIAGGVLSVWR